MADIKITGVMRAGAYSPNHVGNDAAIFNAVADELRKRGCVVNIYSEEQFLEMPVEDDIILNMCRKQESIAKLQLLEDEGKLVINSGFGIQNCTRERMTLLLLHNGIPYPESLTVNTNEDVRKELEQAGFGSCWIKRGDFHAMHTEDVSYCRHIEEAQGVLHEFYYRGIHRAVINRHLEGDLIKFYGVKDRPFFYWFYPFEQGHSKYGDEAINGAPTHLRFDVEDLHHNCQRAAEILDVAVYGGDAIIASDGSFKIIDFNDWPSFAPCRKEAAPHIARYVLAEIKKRQKR